MVTCGIRPTHSAVMLLGWTVNPGDALLPGSTGHWPRATDPQAGRSEPLTLASGAGY